MSKFIITIAREFGSGGRLVGKELGELLGIPVYNKKLIALASRVGGLSESDLADLDERAANKLFYALPSSGYMPSFDLSMNDRVFLLQSQVITDIADRESAVIIGRSGDYVLRDYKNVLKVYIHAPFEDRVQRVVKDYGVSMATAHRKVKKIDVSRAKYYNYYTGKKWGKPENYDLCLDSSALGIENTAKIIADAAKTLFLNDKK